MKRLKSTHYLFIFLNILGIITEYYLLCQVILINVLNLPVSIALILTTLLFLVLSIVTIYTTYQRNNLFDSSDIDETDTFQKSKIDKAKKTYIALTNKKINIKYINTALQPSIMFALLNTIYINTNKKYNYKKISHVHFEGVLSHELGHVLHMPKIYVIAQIRPTAIIGNLFFLITYNLSIILDKKKNRVLNYFLFSIIYILFILTNLLNLFILYPFKRYEELQADRLSLRFSNGYSLRGYYYKLYKENNNRVQTFRFNYIDFNHPSPRKHYESLNNHIINPNINCELYSDNQIEVINYQDPIDKIKQILNFYENNVDKSITKLYIYIGSKYEEVKDINNAKEYYLKAGQNDILSGYRRLIRILKTENNIENVMEYYKILAKNGDIEAKTYINYYEIDFYLYKIIINKEEIHLFDYKDYIRLHINNKYVIERNHQIIENSFRRTRQTIFLKQENGNDLQYYFDNQEIISKTYQIIDESTQEKIEVKEFYKKLDK